MAEEGDRQAQPLLPAVAKPGSTADAQTTRGSVDSARRSMERANYESCTSAASQNVTKIRADPHRSRMDQEPVTLSWENVNVFVREKKKKQKGVLAEDGAVSGVVAETSAVKNGLKQIISNGKFGNIYLFSFFLSCVSVCRVCVCVCVCVCGVLMLAWFEIQLMVDSCVL